MRKEENPPKRKKFLKTKKKKFLKKLLTNTHLYAIISRSSRKDDLDIIAYKWVFVNSFFKNY